MSALRYKSQPAGISGEMPPAYQRLHTEEQPLLVTHTVQIDNPTELPRTHLFSSVLSSLLCCFPLGLMATFYSVRTAVANNEGRVRAASRHSACARTWMRAAVLTGTVLFLVSMIVHGLIFGVVMQNANNGFRAGFKEGFATGQTNAENYYDTQVKVEPKQNVTFPHPVPGAQNFFDFSKSNPLWHSVKKALKTGDWELLGNVFGTEVGKVEGFRYVFCAKPLAACTDDEAHVRYPEPEDN
eukprot:comp22904_c0_seq2/m.36230 comp22904_c0_seq2/g.36230  ORF comp22904_c0_seq2/g.36230 comp22904_c0_seq2/m.36230 type:complete len:241 (-) comp22904_c0_seq2:451-1173(-)